MQFGMLKYFATVLVDTKQPIQERRLFSLPLIGCTHNRVVFPLYILMHTKVYFVFHLLK